MFVNSDRRLRKVGKKICTKEKSDQVTYVSIGGIEEHNHLDCNLKNMSIETSQLY